MLYFDIERLESGRWVRQAGMRYVPDSPLMHDIAIAIRKALTQLDCMENHGFQVRLVDQDGNAP